MKCLGKNHKGNNCNFKPLENDEYCKLHQSYKKMIQLQNENKKVCKNWIRGCWNILTDKYERCIDCRLNEREKEKNLREKKKNNAVTYNNENNTNLMCVSCNKITETQKNNKCEKCYLEVCNSTKNRNPRDVYLSKLYEYKSSAKKRNIEFKLEDDKCIKLFSEPCYYCNKIEIINGIDRIDSNKCYEDTNCVSCCIQCNFMKNDTDKNKFIKLCEHIATYNNLYNGEIDRTILENTKFGRYSQYKKRALEKNKEFKLTKNEFIIITSQPCYYCGVSDKTYYDDYGAGGIDRVDSNKGYIFDNCVPCCGMCNQMKLDYTKEEFLNQCLQITSNQLNFTNKTDMEDNIIKKFNKFNEIKKNKRYKKEFLHSKDYYEFRVWNGSLEDLKNIKVKLVLADNEELLDIWNYYKHYVSSLQFTKNSHLVGKQIYLLIADQLSEKYLGILSLSSDYLFLSDRDDYIGWSKEGMIKDKMLNYIMNISTCVPLQPFGFNFTGGKLLTKLVFSQEVQDIFKNKYGHSLLGITTTSLYGKSIQYDRLKEIKFIGYTKGNSVYKYTTEFVQLCKKYLQDYHNLKVDKKLFIISRTLEKLELPKDEYMKDNPKGIYFGFIYPDSKDFLCGKTNTIKESKLKSINEIFNDWLNRWAIQRANHLINENKFIKPILKTSTEKSKKTLLKLKEKVGEIEYKKQKNEYMKKYREKIKEEQKKNKPIIEPITEPIIEPIIEQIDPNKFTKKPDLPPNFSLYKEKDVWYLSFSKVIDTVRYNKKIVMNTMCIQTELDKLITEINKQYPDLKIDNYVVQNPYDFKDKTELKPVNKRKLPTNFSICTVNGKEYIQFCKSIDGIKKQYKTVLKSTDLQSELNTFVDYLNEKYNFNLEKQII
jgi:hypothetical protein